MGSCHSDLKGEKQEDAGSEAPQPIKKVATNFSTVDYDAAAKGRRDTIVAPHDTARQQSEALPPLEEVKSNPVSQPASVAVPSGVISTAGDRMSFENRLPNQQPVTQDPSTRNQDHLENQEPYRDVTASPASPIGHTNIEEKFAQAQPQSQDTYRQGDNDDTNMGLFSKSKSPSQEPATNGDLRPTMTPSKKRDSYLNSFPADSGPSTPFGHEHDTQAERDQFFPTRTSDSSVYSDQVQEQPKKKSMYQKYQDLKRGPGTSGLSDEELKKYTGMDRVEMEKYAATTPGVAGGQAAGSITAGGTSGIGTSAGAEAGLYGWGHNSAKHPVVR